MMEAFEVVIPKSQALFDGFLRRFHATREILEEVIASPHIPLQSKARRHVQNHNVGVFSKKPREKRNNETMVKKGQFLHSLSIFLSLVYFHSLLNGNRTIFYSEERALAVTELSNSR